MWGTSVHLQKTRSLNGETLHKYSSISSLHSSSAHKYLRQIWVSERCHFCKQVLANPSAVASIPRVQYPLRFHYPLKCHQNGAIINHIVKNTFPLHIQNHSCFLVSIKHRRAWWKLDLLPNSPNLLFPWAIKASSLVFYFQVLTNPGFTVQKKQCNWKISLSYEISWNFSHENDIWHYKRQENK